VRLEGRARDLRHPALRAGNGNARSLHNEPREKIVREVTIPETITIQDLANRMSERAVDIVERYGPERLEAACARAQSIRSPRFKTVDAILKSGMDRQAPKPEPAQASLPLHDNVRGADYYH